MVAAVRDQALAMAVTPRISARLVSASNTPARMRFSMCMNTEPTYQVRSMQPALATITRASANSGRSAGIDKVVHASRPGWPMNMYVVIGTRIVQKKMISNQMAGRAKVPSVRSRSAAQNANRAPRQVLTSRSTRMASSGAGQRLVRALQATRGVK